MTEASVRPEDISTRAELSRALTELRTRAGRTVRDLARALDVPVATIGGYCSGRHLPGPAQEPVYLRLLGECGVGEPAELEAWLEALWRCRRTSDRRSARAVAPHPGLEPYGEEDAGRFFGREEAVGVVLTALSGLAGAGGGIAALVGASGSGKSSLLQAGVLPAVRAGGLGAAEPGSWSVMACTPGDDPLGTLETAAAEVGRPGLVVVDQLEEVFAPGIEAMAREQFLAGLADLAGSGRVVLVGLRADFYEAAAGEPILHRALADHQVLLGPMTDLELRRAIVEPARAVGAAVEEGLVEVLLGDLALRPAGAPAHEPGALPLLSHALRATWARSQSNALTLEAYRASGGVAGAVRQSAEDLYRSLAADEQVVARRILLRLVHVAEDAPSTRRRVRRCELAALGEGGSAEVVEAVLERFVEARLVTADADQVTLSHEALLVAWPRLAAWLAEDLTGLQLLHRLSEAANAWAATGRDEGLLLRGNRLQGALELLGSAEHAGELNALEVELVQASEARTRAEAATERRRSRRFQVLLGASLVLLLAVATLAGYAFQARSAATAARDAALSRQLAIEARQLASRDPSLAAQLALAGYRRSPTVEARSALLDATAGPMVTRLVGPPGPAYAAFGDRAHLVAVARSADRTVELYRSVAGRTRSVARIDVRAAGSAVFAVALDRAGRLLAVGGTGKDVLLYDLSDPSHPRLVAELGGFASTVYDLAFSSSSDELAAADADGTVRRWRLGPNGVVRPAGVLVAPGRAAVKAVAISPKGDLVAAAGAAGRLELWPAGAAAPAKVAGLGGATIESVAFSPSGDLLATAGSDGLVRVYRIGPGPTARPVRAPLPGLATIAYAVAFSPSGGQLVAADAEGTIRLWSTARWTAEATVREPDPVTSLAFGPGGNELVTADGAGMTMIWPLPLPAMVRAPGSVYFFAEDVRAGLVAAVSGGSAGDVELWRLHGAGPARRVARVEPAASFGPVAGSAALDSSGRLLAMADTKGAVQLVDLSQLAHPRPVGRPLTGDTPYVEELAFSPSGRQLVAGDDGNAIHRWSLADPSRPVPLPTLHGPHGPVMSVAFSPNGRLLAAGSADAHVYLYDLRRPSHPRLLDRLGAFASYVFSVAFSPSGRTLAAGTGSGAIRLWALAEGRRPRPVARLSGPTSYVYQLAVSPDGRLLAAATTGGKVWVWRIADPARPVLEDTLEVASGSLFSVAFTDHGRVLLAGGTDEVLHRWLVSPSSAAARICAVAGSPVTRAEWTEYAPGTPYRPPCP